MKLDACLKDFDEGLESMMGGRGYAICCCRDAAVSETHKENMDKAGQGTRTPTPT